MIFFNEYSIEHISPAYLRAIGKGRHLSNEVSAGLFNDQIFIAPDICLFQSAEELTDRVMRFDSEPLIGNERVT